MRRKRRHPRTVRRFLEAIFDRLQAGPLSLLVFFVSAIVLLLIQFGALLQVDAPAVARAVPMEHPSRLESVVATAHVQPGDFVEAGTPLVTLSQRNVLRELDLVEAEIARLEKLRALEQARLNQSHEERRIAVRGDVSSAELGLGRAWAAETRAKSRLNAAQEQLEHVSAAVKNRLRNTDSLDAVAWRKAAEAAEVKGAKAERVAEANARDQLQASLDGLDGSVPLVKPTADLYEAELEVFRVRRRALLEDMRDATITARESGRVSLILPEGTSVTLGASVATILPDQATEIVAYVPPSTDPTTITPGTLVAFTEPALACNASGVVLRHGAGVEEAPAQIRSPLRMAVHGLPVYISVPDSCRFGPGQLLAVQFDREGP